MEEGRPARASDDDGRRNGPVEAASASGSIGVLVNIRQSVPNDLARALACRIVGMVGRGADLLASRVSTSRSDTGQHGLDHGADRFNPRELVSRRQRRSHAGPVRGRDPAQLCRGGPVIHLAFAGPEVSGGPKHRIANALRSTRAQVHFHPGQCIDRGQARPHKSHNPSGLYSSSRPPPKCINLVVRHPAMAPPCRATEPQRPTTA